MTSETPPPFQSFAFESFTLSQLTQEILAEAARLFNENYATWGAKSHTPGAPVTVTPQKLLKEYLRCTTESSSSYTRAVIDSKVVGQAFVTRWKGGGWNICWVTQLVVDKAYRRQGIATGLLRAMRQDADDVYGIMSSHPAGCMAAARAFSGQGIVGVDLDFISQYAQRIARTSPIPYIRDLELRGTIFNEDDDYTGMISSVNVNFFVDQTESLEALDNIQQDNGTLRRGWRWPLGDLLEGNEFIALFCV